jgi:transposase
MMPAVEAGASRRATAAKFEDQPELRGQVKLRQRWRQRGTLEPDPVSGGRRAKRADHAERVVALLAATPDLTIAELRTRLAADGITVSASAISRFLKACGLTRKNTAHAAEQDRPDVAAARRAWRAQQPPAEPGASGIPPPR